MSIIAAAVRELIAAGLSGEPLLAAIERIEAAADTRSPGAKRTERWRLKASQNVTHVTCDVNETQKNSAPLKEEILPSSDQDDLRKEDSSIRFGKKVAAILRSIPPQIDHFRVVHDAAQKALVDAGIKTVREFEIKLGAHSGFIDLVAFGFNGGCCAIEIDARTPKAKSIKKLLAFNGYRIAVIRGNTQPLQFSSGIHETIAIPLIDEEKSDSSDWPVDFQDQFWASYPRKVGRLAARRLLGKIKQSGEVTWARIIAAARAYAVNAADPQFTKHPTTWLNAGCWDDQFGEPPRSNPAGLAEPDYYAGWTSEQVAYAKLHFGWRPGLPTAEELADQLAERRKANLNGHHGEGLQRSSAEIHRGNGQEGASYFPDDRADEPEFSVMGGVLRSASSS